MDNRKQRHTDPWDRGVYGTGKTQPPKSHGGIIALLCVLVIFLCGLVTILSILNIRLFRQLNAQPEALAALSFSDRDTAATEAFTEPLETFSLLEPPQLVLGVDPSAAQEENEPMTWKEIFETGVESLVQVSCRTYDGSVQGTGIILSADGSILTNHHVIEEAESILVSFADGEIYQAVLAGKDRLTDLAVLRIEPKSRTLLPAHFGSSDSVAEDDPVAVVEFGARSARLGYIQETRAHWQIGSTVMSLIRTDTKSGCGSPLFNSYGQIIAIHTDLGQDGGSFAIPIAAVKEIVDQLLTYGYVPGRPELGFEGTFLGAFEQHYYNMPQGMYITRITGGTDADTKGIRVGDILVGINGLPVTDSRMLYHQVYAMAVGDSVTLEISRNGERLRLNVTLTEAAGP